MFRLGVNCTIGSRSEEKNGLKDHAKVVHTKYRCLWRQSGYWNFSRGMPAACQTPLHAAFLKGFQEKIGSQFCLPRPESTERGQLGVFSLVPSTQNRHKGVICVAGLPEGSEHTSA